MHVPPKLTSIIFLVLLPNYSNALPSATCYLASAMGAFIKTDPTYEGESSIHFRANDLELYDIHLSYDFRRIGLIEQGEVVRDFRIRGTVNPSCQFPSNTPSNYACEVANPEVSTIVFAPQNPEPIRQINHKLDRVELFQQKGPDTQGIGLRIRYKGIENEYSDGLVNCQR